jgi:hypothetical protein
VDSISLNVAKTELIHKQQSAKAGPGTTTRVGWDRKANTAF